MIQDYIRFKGHSIFAPRVGRGYTQQTEDSPVNFYLWDEKNVFQKRSTLESVGYVALSAFIDRSVTSKEFDNTLLTIRSEKLGRNIALYNKDGTDLIDVIKKELESNNGEKTAEKAKLLLFLYILNEDLGNMVNSFDINRFYDVSTADEIFRTIKDSVDYETVRKDFFEKITSKCNGLLSKTIRGNDYAMVSEMDDIDFHYHVIPNFEPPAIVKELSLDFFWRKDKLKFHSSHPDFQKDFVRDDKKPVNDTNVSASTLWESFHSSDLRKNEYTDAINSTSDPKEEGIQPEEDTEVRFSFEEEPPQEEPPPPSENKPYTTEDYEDLFGFNEP